MKDNIFASRYVERQRKKQVTKKMIDNICDLPYPLDIDIDKLFSDECIVSVFGKEGDGMSSIASNLNSDIKKRKRT